MSMTYEEIKSRFSGLSTNRKIYLLIWLAHNITVSARMYYDEQPSLSKNMSKLRIFNEILHTISSQIGHMLSKSDRYPDETFIDIIFEKARIGKCEKALIWAFEVTWSIKQLNESE